MSEISYRCPDTGLRVQTWTMVGDGDSDNLYEAVTCTACQRVHLINVKSGRVLGTDVGDKRAQRG